MTLNFEIATSFFLFRQSKIGESKSRDIFSLSSRTWTIMVFMEEKTVSALCSLKVSNRTTLSTMFTQFASEVKN
jgi:hypothetical protein